MYALGNRYLTLPVKGASLEGLCLEPRSKTQVTLQACLFGRHSRHSALCQPVLGERADRAVLSEPTVHGEPRRRGSAVVRT